jgi:hypothetical protein
MVAKLPALQKMWTPGANNPSFSTVMGFSGSPEIINGRLAMMAVVAAIGAELSSGESVLRQVADEPTGIVALFLLVIAGSLIPALVGSKPEAIGPLNPTAELINGRAAMIGFASLLVIEQVNNGAALF